MPLAWGGAELACGGCARLAGAGRGAPLPSWGQVTAGGLAPGPAFLVSVRRALESALKVGPGPLGDPRPQGGGGTGGSGEAGPREMQRKTDIQTGENGIRDTEVRGREKRREETGVSTHTETERTSVAREGETDTATRETSRAGSVTDQPGQEGPQEALCGQSPAQLQDSRPGPPPGTPHPR